MATTKSTTTRTAPRGRTESASVAAHSHTELEAKVASLEGQLAAAVAAVAALEARVVACESAEAAPAAASGRDEDLRERLRIYFDTVANGKVPTRMPSL